MSELVEVVVGAVGRAHGVRGDVAIDVRTDEPERRFAVGATLRIDGSPRSLTVDRLRWHSGRLLVGFDGVVDRTGAEGLRGSLLVVDVAVEEQPEDPEEFYDRQLVGLAAILDGAVVGRVTSVVHLPAQDLLAIDVEGQERLVPFVTELVPSVDLAGGLVVLRDIPGLLHEQDEDA